MNRKDDFVLGDLHFVIIFISLEEAFQVELLRRWFNPFVNGNFYANI